MAKISKFKPLRFIEEVKLEGSKVTWATGKETRITTVVVFFMVFIIAMFLFFADWLISLLVQWILGIGS
ncbi:MAG: preprotein translocase subunit SecE [Micavibrio sp.]|jgi:preprotein translocase SecE subunit|nr:MAG: preprotein translocase subunit SecE [Micavibrio sp.]